MAQQSAKYMDDNYANREKSVLVLATNIGMMYAPPFPIRKVLLCLCESLAFTLLSIDITVSPLS